MSMSADNSIGPIALFGSGETSPAAQRIHHEVMSRVTAPVRAAIIETPAGFEPNSDMVARKIAEYLTHRLQNFDPQCELVPARMRGTDFSPDDPALAGAIFRSNYVFMGPGSPTYAVRHLQDSFTWHSMLAQHRLGAAIVFSSASTISVSKYALPVYEIYKVGEELHWKDGLDFFAHFGLNLMITPHWNNNDGGDELDTSRCYMGQERYERLLALLPRLPVILGIEENTGVVINPDSGECTVVGVGETIVLRDGKETRFAAGGAFSVDLLGPWRLPRDAGGNPRGGVGASASGPHGAGRRRCRCARAGRKNGGRTRGGARAEQNWQTADRLRDELMALGWQVDDTADGPQVVRREDV